MYIDTHFLLFFFNDTATTEIYTLSLHDALPISGTPVACYGCHANDFAATNNPNHVTAAFPQDCSLCHTTLKRSEEHTSELQSRQYLVCRLLLEKKKKPTKRLSKIPKVTLSTTRL